MERGRERRRGNGGGGGGGDGGRGGAGDVNTGKLTGQAANRTL